MNDAMVWPTAERLREMLVATQEWLVEQAKLPVAELTPSGTRWNSDDTNDLIGIRDHQAIGPGEEGVPVFSMAEWPEEEDFERCTEVGCGTPCCVGGFIEHNYKVKLSANLAWLQLTGTQREQYDQLQQLFFMYQFQATTLREVDPMWAHRTIQLFLDTGIVDWYATREIGIGV